MGKQKILLIEDEEDIADLLKLQAEISGYDLVVVSDGVKGLLAVSREMPDLIILDIMLPRQSGLDVCRKIKEHLQYKHIPIIILSAKSEEQDVVLGLDLGADDYVTKPFSPKILFHRVHAVLRRIKDLTNSNENIVFGPFILTPDLYKLNKGKEQMILTLTEFEILSRLAKCRGKVLTRNQLLDCIQKYDASIVDRNIDVHIASLRRKLGPSFNWIETVRGVGYRFKESA